MVSLRIHQGPPFCRENSADYDSSTIQSHVNPPCFSSCNRFQPLKSPSSVGTSCTFCSLLKGNENHFEGYVTISISTLEISFNAFSPIAFPCIFPHQSQFFFLCFFHVRAFLNLSGIFQGLCQKNR